MRTLSIPQILELEHGEVIPHFEGKVETVYEQKTGQGQYGPWWLQNMVVRDGDSTLTVTWGGEDDLKSLEGHICSFEASQGKKGLAGIKKDIRTYDGKKYEGVKLTETCKIRILDDLGANGGHPADPEIVPNEKSMWTQPQSGAIGAQPSKELSEVDKARKHLMQASNLYCLCVDAVNKVVGPHIRGIGDGSLLNPDMFQASVSTLFIEASRKGLISSMPEKPLKE